MQLCGCGKDEDTGFYAADAGGREEGESCFTFDKTNARVLPVQIECLSEECGFGAVFLGTGVSEEEEEEEAPSIPSKHAQHAFSKMKIFNCATSPML